MEDKLSPNNHGLFEIGVLTSCILVYSDKKARMLSAYFILLLTCYFAALMSPFMEDFLFQFYKYALKMSTQFEFLFIYMATDWQETATDF